MNDEKLIHLCQTCIDFNNRVSGANSCTECWDKMKEKELGMIGKDEVQILIKMDKETYGFIRNLDNLEEKEGIFPSIAAFNTFVEAVRDGKIVEVKGDLEKTADVAENVDGWCNTCKHKHHKSKCIYCAKYDEHDNLIALSNYESED